MVAINIQYFLSVFSMLFKSKDKGTIQSLKRELKLNSNLFLIGFVPMLKTATFVIQNQHPLWNCSLKYLSFY